MLYHARKVRAVLGIENEYALRRSLNTVLPAPTPAIGALVHACTWKTASQWVRIVLSDPRFYMRTGLTPHSYKAARPPERIFQNSLLTNAFIDYSVFEQWEKPADTRAFFVVRDPRDLCVSRFFSARYSHPKNNGIVQLREKMEKMSDEEGLIYTMTDRFEPIATRIQSWVKAAETQDIPIIRFEQLTGPDRVDTWSDLTRRLNLDVDKKTISTLLDFYRAEKFRPKTATLASKEVKYRSGKPGEWADHFSPRVTKVFEELYGDLPGKLGYPA
jgi:hypothetical protein